MRSTQAVILFALLALVNTKSDYQIPPPETHTPSTAEKFADEAADKGSGVFFINSPG